MVFSICANSIWMYKEQARWCIKPMAVKDGIFMPGIQPTSEFGTNYWRVPGIKCETTTEPEKNDPHPLIW